MSERDDALEAAAALCEEGMGIWRLAGIGARKKLDRQLAEARNKGYDEAAAKFASLIRLMKTGGSLSEERRLANLAGMENSRYVTGRDMLDALRFADAGLCKVEVRMPLGENRAIIYFANRWPTQPGA